LKVPTSQHSISLEDECELSESADTNELEYLRLQLKKMTNCFAEYAKKSENINEYLLSKLLDESDQNRNNIELLEFVYNQFLER
jgi:hypothetical protein